MCPGFSFLAEMDSARMDDSDPLPTHLFALFPFAFVGMWCATTFLLSVLSGWRRLAEHFPAGDRPRVGEAFFMQGGSIGGVTYKGCLNVRVNPEGFFLSVLFPFRLGSAPLFIPWSAVHRPTIRRFLWRIEAVECEIGSPPVARVLLPKRIFTGYVLPPSLPGKAG